VSFAAAVHVVHVFPESVQLGPPLVPGPVLVGQLRDLGRQAFDDYLVRARARGPAEATLAEGVPHVEIVRLAGEIGADLVVMGTHGRTGLQHVLLGSVAERVVRSSPVPVLVVPPSPGTPAGRE